MSKRNTGSTIGRELSQGCYPTYSAAVEQRTFEFLGLETVSRSRMTEVQTYLLYSQTGYDVTS